MQIDVLEADYLNQQHARDIGELLNRYAMDPMGGAAALDHQVVENIATALSRLPQAFSVLCYANGEAVGLVNCFEAFSTFSCKPLVNIHDVFVTEDYRGQGISHLMLDEVERIALSRGCCKLTLEVLEGNQLARSAYENFGFSGYSLDPATGSAMFWEKPLGIS